MNTMAINVAMTNDKVFNLPEMNDLQPEHNKVGTAGLTIKHGTHVRRAPG